MTRRARPSGRPAGKRPPRREVEVSGPKGFDDWACRARADFPTSTLADLQSGSVDRIVKALDVIVIEHNFPNVDDDVAATMGDVDPYSGLLAMSAAIIDAIGKLPPR